MRIGGRSVARPRSTDMNTITLDNPDLPVEVRRRAQVTVAGHSQSTADCALLLDILGIAGIE